MNCSSELSKLLTLEDKIKCRNYMKEIPLIQNGISDILLDDIYSERMPVIFRGFNIGTCVQLWNVDYLMKHIGHYNLRIHVSTCPSLNFSVRNFTYESLSASELLKRTASDSYKSLNFIKDPSEFYYFRSVGNKHHPSFLRDVFPEIASDVCMEHMIPTEHIHSSMLRISSPKIHIWTHYDVMDNLLLQIMGFKRVVLFSPFDVDKLYMKGDKPLISDPWLSDFDKYPLFRDVCWHTASLLPGDILFIPALWLHSTSSCDPGPCISVNTFWPHLDRKYYDSSDIYANKDPLPASKENINNNCQSWSLIVDDHKTHIVIYKYSNYSFVIITQLGGISSLIEVTCECINTPGNINIYNSRILFGPESDILFACCRRWAEYFPNNIPILFALAFKSSPSVNAVRCIADTIAVK